MKHPVVLPATMKIIGCPLCSCVTSPSVMRGTQAVKLKPCLMVAVSMFDVVVACWPRSSLQAGTHMYRWAKCLLQEAIHHADWNKALTCTLT